MCEEGEVKHIRWSRLCLSANLLAVPFATLLGLAPNAQARLAVLRIVSPHQGPTIRGFTHTTVKVAGEAQKVDVYIDRHYLRSGPSYIISWSSTEVSNGPHRITDTDLRGAATNSILTATSSAVLVLADQRERGNVRKHGATPIPTATSTLKASPTPTPDPPTPTATPPTPTPKASPTPTPVQKATPTPTPGSGPTPVALNNPQNPVAYGADATGTNDSTSAFQNAINAGDLDVHAGVYKILGTVTVPDARNIRCESGAALANQTSSSSWTMFQFNGNTSGSFFDCQFRGPNYNINAKPGSQQNFEEFIFIQSIGNNGTTGNILISGNDFDGAGGFVGSIGIYANDSNQPPPHNVRIAYNTFEHCGYYAVQLTSGENNLIDHNILNDCSGFVEADDTGQQNTDNVIDSNHLTFTYGIGMNYPGCNPGCGFDGLTGGANASGGYFNYSGNMVSNNIVDGTHPSSILIDGNNTPAQYNNNTCTGGCQMNVYQ